MVSGAGGAGVLVSASPSGAAGGSAGGAAAPGGGAARERLTRHRSDTGWVVLRARLLVLFLLRAWPPAAEAAEEKAACGALRAGRPSAGGTDRLSAEAAAAAEASSDDRAPGRPTATRASEAAAGPAAAGWAAAAGRSAAAGWAAAAGRLRRLGGWRLGSAPLGSPGRTGRAEPGGEGATLVGEDAGEVCAEAPADAWDGDAPSAPPPSVADAASPGEVTAGPPSLPVSPKEGNNELTAGAAVRRARTPFGKPDQRRRDEAVPTATRLRPAATRAGVATRAPGPGFAIAFATAAWLP